MLSSFDISALGEVQSAMDTRIISITMETITNPEIWDAALNALPSPHVLQSWIWGELKGGRGWSPLRFLWYVDGRAVAAAQLLIIERGRVRLGYIPKGPVLDWADATLVTEVLASLTTFARDRGLLLLKIDPDVPANTEAGRTIGTRLMQQGWHASFEQIQLRNTMVMDLRPDLDQLMKQMKPKWRYNIQLAVRRGVTIREATSDDWPLLWEMYAETAARDGFVIRERPYYLGVWEQFVRAGMSWSLVAEVHGQPVAMAIAFYYGACVWYMYGASRALHRHQMPNHLLQWEIIRRAKAAGCTCYDLWGAPDRLDTSDPRWGLFRFKEGFGAVFVPHIGAYDYTPHQLLYRFYAFLRPRGVALAHLQYWARVRTS